MPEIRRFESTKKRKRIVELSEFTRIKLFRATALFSAFEKTRETCDTTLALIEEPDEDEHSVT